MHNASVAAAVVAVSLFLGLPTSALAQTAAHGRATVHVPELLSFQVEEELEAGRVVAVVVVRSNRDWRLVVRGRGQELVLQGGPGRNERRRLPEWATVTGRSGEDAVEVTLSAG